MITADSHLHSAFSFDCETAPEENMKTALEKGLTRLTFTDHQDWDPKPDRHDFSVDAYFAVLKKLREKYEEKLAVTIGVELGLIPDQTEAYRRFTAEYPFEFVIGSVHTIQGMDPYDGDYFHERSFDEAYREAFCYTADCLKRKPDIDVLGHLDYVVRYGDKNNDIGFYARFSDEIDEILKLMIEQGIGIEVNTAGYRYGLPQPNPSCEVISRYRELGGELVTVGSDAHDAQSLGFGFLKICEFLSSCGFRFYAYFQNRTPVFERI